MIDTKEEIADGIATLVRTLRAILPETKILLLGILPRNGLDLFYRVADINALIGPPHDGTLIFFLGMFANFATGDIWGTVPSTFFNDGLHLTTVGYQKWADGTTF